MTERDSTFMWVNPGIFIHQESQIILFSSFLIPLSACAVFYYIYRCSGFDFFFLLPLEGFNERDEVLFFLRNRTTPDESSCSVELIYDRLDRIRSAGMMHYVAGVALRIVLWA